MDKNLKSLWKIVITMSVMLVISAACGGGEPQTPTPIPPTPAPAATSTPSAEDHFDAGTDYLAEEQFDRAIAEFEEAIRLEPGKAETHYNLGLAYYQSGDVDKAIAAYEEAIQLNPELTDAYTNLGVAYDAQGRSDEAIAAYEEAIQLDPDQSEAYYNLGNLYDELRELEQAVAYSAAIQIDPQDADAHYNLGQTYYRQGLIDEAIVEWKETIRIQPDDSMAHNNVGRAYYDQGWLDEAVVELKEAIRLDEENTLAYFNLGLAYKGQGRTDETIAAFETYLGLIPTDHPNRDLVAQEIAKLKGPAGGETAEYRNTAGGYSFHYPASMLVDQDETWTTVAGKQAALDAAFENALEEAILEAPIVMIDAMGYDGILEDLDLEEGAGPDDVLQTLADMMVLDTEEIRTGTVNGYPAAISRMTMGGKDGYPGILVCILVEERGIVLSSMGTPDEWETFEPTFMALLDTIRFFEPEE